MVFNSSPPLLSSASPFVHSSDRIKQTSFSDYVITRTIEPVLAAQEENSDNSDGDFMDESAIEDDDESSDWEDSIEENGKSNIDECLFRRVDSTPQLSSRRSLITLMVEHDVRVRAIGNTCSQSTPVISRPVGSAPVHPTTTASSPNDSDEAALMMRTSNRQPNFNTITESSSNRTLPQPILMVPHQTPHPQAALSPRTTRKQMLTTELTESLRLSLVWERHHKTSTANAVLKRRHTTHDVAHLQQFPEKVHRGPYREDDVNKWNVDFIKDINTGYHSKGW